MWPSSMGAFRSALFRLITQSMKFLKVSQFRAAMRDGLLFLIATQPDEHRYARLHRPRQDIPLIRRICFRLYYGCLPWDRASRVTVDFFGSGVPRLGVPISAS